MKTLLNTLIWLIIVVIIVFQPMLVFVVFAFALFWCSVSAMFAVQRKRVMSEQAADLAAHKKKAFEELRCKLAALEAEQRGDVPQRHAPKRRKKSHLRLVK